MKENLILSGAHDLDYEKLAPFLKSLRATGSRAKVHFFLTGISEKGRQKIESLGVTTERFNYFHFRRRRPLLLFWPIWKRMLASRDLASKCRLAQVVFHFAAFRNALFLEYLQNHPGAYNQVLLTDCRDVYFQRDPFSDILEPGLHCFLEAKTQFVGQCPANQRMVRTAFGSAVAAEMEKTPVSCSGTVLGDAASIQEYAKRMIECFCTVQKVTASNDQGVHNVLIHRGLLPSLHLHDNYTSSVFTAGCEPTESIRFNDRSEVIRQDGKPYPVLHQIDRHKEIYAQLLAKLDAV